MPRLADRREITASRLKVLRAYLVSLEHFPGTLCIINRIDPETGLGQVQI
jgi:hypothetical protein